MLDMDEKVSDWIQASWEKGDSLHLDTMSLGHASSCHSLGRYSLFWRKLESPNRAPPLTATIINAWVMCAISHLDLEFAAMLCLGFYGLLRTGEMLQNRPCDVLLGAENGVISLSETKTGLRNSAKETVSITSILALETLQAAVELKNSQGLHRVPIWSKFSPNFLRVFAHHIKRFNLEAHQFRPYSLRRGGGHRPIPANRKYGIGPVKGPLELI